MGRAESWVLSYCSFQMLLHNLIDLDFKWEACKIEVIIFILLVSCGFVFIHRIPIFLNFFCKGEPQIYIFTIFNKLQIFYKNRLVCRLWQKTKFNYLWKIQIFFNRRKIPRKINESAVYARVNFCFLIFSSLNQTWIFWNIACNVDFFYI